MPGRRLPGPEDQPIHPAARRVAGAPTPATPTGAGGRSGREGQEQVDRDEREAVPPSVRPMLRRPMPRRAERRRTSDRARSIGGIVCIALVAVGVWAASLASPKVGAQAVTSASSIQVRANDTVGRDLYVARWARAVRRVPGQQSLGHHRQAALTDFVLVRSDALPTSTPEFGVPDPDRGADRGSGWLVSLARFRAADRRSSSPVRHGPWRPSLSRTLRHAAAREPAADAGSRPEPARGGPAQRGRSRYRAVRPDTVFQFITRRTPSPLRRALDHGAPSELTIAEVGPVPEGFVAGVFGLLTLLILARWIGRPRPSALALISGRSGGPCPGQERPPGPGAGMAPGGGRGGGAVIPLTRPSGDGPRRTIRPDVAASKW
jgi:hypothetical protein